MARIGQFPDCDVDVFPYDLSALSAAVAATLSANRASVRRELPHTNKKTAVNGRKTPNSERQLREQWEFAFPSATAKYQFAHLTCTAPIGSVFFCKKGHS
jgi:hypothetical protein